MARALAAGVGFVPQDRHHEGLVPDMSIADNATLTIPDRLGTAGFLSTRRRDAIATRLIEDLAIKTPGPDLPVSGCPAATSRRSSWPGPWPTTRVLVLSTHRGVDVRSKEFLLGRSSEVADAGTGVLVVSDELDDLRVCDRVLVMFQGRVVAEIAAAGATTSWSPRWKDWTVDA